MKELQMLINKWQLEADDIKSKNGAAVNFAAMPIAAEYRRLRKCINEAQLLFDEKFSNDLPPQLHKHDVIGCKELLEQLIADDIKMEQEYHRDYPGLDVWNTAERNAYRRAINIINERQAL